MLPPTSYAQIYQEHDVRLPNMTPRVHEVEEELMHFKLKMDLRRY